METSSAPTRRRVLPALAAAALLGVAGAGYLATSRGPAFHGTTYDDVTPAAEFTLVDHAGRPAALRDFRGRVVLLFFGFTHCPDVCPLTLSKLARVTESLGTRPEELSILLVTLDPERDTPAALGGYVRRFTPLAVGLTGDSASLARAYRGYGVYTVPGTTHGGHAGKHAPAAAAGAMTHSTAVYGIDREGRLQVVMSPGASEDDLRDAVRTLLSL